MYALKSPQSWLLPSFFPSLLGWTRVSGFHLFFWAICWGPPFLCQMTGLQVGVGLRVTCAGPRADLLGAVPQMVLKATL